MQREHDKHTQPRNEYDIQGGEEGGDEWEEWTGAKGREADHAAPGQEDATEAQIINRGIQIKGNGRIAKVKRRGVYDEGGKVGTQRCRRRVVRHATKENCRPIHRTLRVGRRCTFVGSEKVVKGVAGVARL